MLAETGRGCKRYVRRPERRAPRSLLVASSRHAAKDQAFIGAISTGGDECKRGEVQTAAGGTGHARKPRPVVIVQDERFDATKSVTICAFTSDPTDAPLLRLAVEPNETNGLRATSLLMVDKITPMPKARLGSRIGRLADTDMVRLNRAVMIFLGLAG